MVGVPMGENDFRQGGNTRGRQRNVYRTSKERAKNEMMEEQSLDEELMVDAELNPTKLFSSINRGDIAKAMRRAQISPKQVRTWIVRRRSTHHDGRFAQTESDDNSAVRWKYLPLHLACLQSNPSHDLIQILLQVYPQAAKCRDFHGNMPFHYLLNQLLPQQSDPTYVGTSAMDSMLESIQMVLEAYPKVMYKTDGQHRTLQNLLQLFHNDSKSKKRWTYEQQQQYDNHRTVLEQRLMGILFQYQYQHPSQQQQMYPNEISHDPVEEEEHHHYNEHAEGMTSISTPTCHTGSSMTSTTSILRNSTKKRHQEQEQNSKNRNHVEEVESRDDHQVHPGHGVSIELQRQLDKLEYACETKEDQIQELSELVMVLEDKISKSTTQRQLLMRSIMKQQEEEKKRAEEAEASRFTSHAESFPHTAASWTMASASTKSHEATNTSTLTQDEELQSMKESIILETSSEQKKGANDSTHDTPQKGEEEIVEEKVQALLEVKCKSMQQHLSNTNQELHENKLRVQSLEVEVKEKSQRIDTLQLALEEANKKVEQQQQLLRELEEQKEFEREQHRSQSIKQCEEKSRILALEEELKKQNNVLSIFIDTITTHVSKLEEYTSNMSIHQHRASMNVIENNSSNNTEEDKEEGNATISNVASKMKSKNDHEANNSNFHYSLLKKELRSKLISLDAINALGGHEKLDSLRKALFSDDESSFYAFHGLTPKATIAKGDIEKKETGNSESHPDCSASEGGQSLNTFNSTLPKENDNKSFITETTFLSQDTKTRPQEQDMNSPKKESSCQYESKDTQTICNQDQTRMTLLNEDHAKTIFDRQQRLQSELRDIHSEIEAAFPRKISTDNQTAEEKEQYHNDGCNNLSSFYREEKEMMQQNTSLFLSKVNEMSTEYGDGCTEKSIRQ